MKYLDIDNWLRKGQYDLFRKMDYPQFNICANVDITKFYNRIKEQRLSFYHAMIWLASNTANKIDEFKYRIREDRVAVHDSVHPSFTLLTREDTFSFCTEEYIPDFARFMSDIGARAEMLKGKVNLADEPGRDDLLYITCIPWVSFTSITHPIHINAADSVPRISWGKYFHEGESIKMPLSVQVNHALMDGYHVGQYFNVLQELLDNTEKHI